MLCFTAASLVLESAAAFHADHDCSGEDCPVCLLIERAKIFFRQLKAATFHSDFSGRALFFTAFVLISAAFRPVLLSLAGLKVRLNR